MKILLVDDDQFAISLFKKFLEKESFEVVTAFSSKDALDILAIEEIDVVITDWMMPEMDGYELTKAIREQQANRYVFIIMISARGGKWRYIEAMESGVDDFISKPLDGDEVLAKLRTAKRMLAYQSVLYERSITDKLTGLSNRSKFYEFFQKEWRRLARNASPLSLLMIDVDHFKKYNDTYGHLAGDKALQEVSSVLKHASQRVTDLAARLGGEEFAIIYSNTDLNTAHRYAESIRTAVSNLRIRNEGVSPDHYLSVSIGIFSLSVTPSESMDTFIEFADKALYQAKSRGRNQICLYPNLVQEGLV
ncbi:MAG: diguanylate cyclase [Chloroherpetonaceae bacterium]|nr:diguanylate cyclase [Chloroherpetonaceae bacterium]